MNRIVVTGSSGFIGLNFVSHLLGRTNWEIHGFDKHALPANSLGQSVANSSRYKHFAGNLLNRNSIRDALLGSNLVVHFAAETHNDNSIANPGMFLESNVIGTFNLLEEVRELGLRIHHVSTDEVFGDLPLSSEKFDEFSNYKPSSPYSATKASSDHLVRAWSRTYGVPSTISNCSNNYGPGQSIENFIPRQIVRLLKGHKPVIYGNGKNIRDWINVSDHCDAILRIITEGKIGQTFLVGTSNEKSNLEIVQVLLKLLNFPEDYFEFVDDRPGHDFRYSIDSSKLTEELNWNPPNRDLEDDLMQLIDWYRSNKDWWLSDFNQKFSNVK